VAGRLQSDALKTNLNAMAYLSLEFDNLLRLVSKVKKE